MPIQFTCCERILQFGGDYGSGAIAVAGRPRPTFVQENEFPKSGHKSQMGCFPREIVPNIMSARFVPSGHKSEIWMPDGGCWMQDGVGHISIVFVDKRTSEHRREYWRKAFGDKGLGVSSNELATRISVAKTRINLAFSAQFERTQFEEQTALTAARTGSGIRFRTSECSPIAPSIGIGIPTPLR